MKPEGISGARPPRRRAPGGHGLVRLHGDIQGPRRGAWDPVFRLVRRIPRGRVMTYGQIATLLGSRLSPRAVGWALHGCPRDVPWQRVVNASGGCSTDRLPDIAPGLQRARLEAEGVQFRRSGTLDLAQYRWTPSRRTGRRKPAPRREVESPRQRLRSRRG